MSVPTLGHAAVNSMFLPNRRGVLKRDTNLRAKAHRMALESVQGDVDTGEPLSMRFSRGQKVDMKKLRQEAARSEHVEKCNRKLVDKMMMIMQGLCGTIVSEQTFPDFNPGTLNYRVRQRELLRIDRANSALLHRLETTSSGYNKALLKPKHFQEPHMGLFPRSENSVKSAGSRSGKRTRPLGSSTVPSGGGTVTSGRGRGGGNGELGWGASVTSVLTESSAFPTTTLGKFHDASSSVGIVGPLPRQGEGEREETELRIGPPESPDGGGSVDTVGRLLQTPHPPSISSRATCGSTSGRAPSTLKRCRRLAKATPARPGATVFQGGVRVGDEYALLTVTRATEGFGEDGSQGFRLKAYFPLSLAACTLGVAAAHLSAFTAGSRTAVRQLFQAGEKSRRRWESVAACLELRPWSDYAMQNPVEEPQRAAESKSDSLRRAENVGGEMSTATTAAAAAAEAGAATAETTTAAAAVSLGGLEGTEEKGAEATAAQAAEAAATAAAVATAMGPGVCRFEMVLVPPQDAPVIIIQRLVRGRLMRETYKMLKRAIVIIQAAVRGWKYRMAKRQYQAATRIAAISRGKRGRNRARQERAARGIQKHTRSWLRKRDLEKENAAKQIQEAVRRRYEHLRRERTYIAREESLFLLEKSSAETRSGGGASGRRHGYKNRAASPNNKRKSPGFVQTSKSSGSSTSSSSIDRNGRFARDGGGGGGGGRGAGVALNKTPNPVCGGVGVGSQGRGGRGPENPEKVAPSGGGNSSDGPTRELGTKSSPGGAGNGMKGGGGGRGGGSGMSAAAGRAACTPPRNQRPRPPDAKDFTRSPYNRSAGGWTRGGRGRGGMSNISPSAGRSLASTVQSRLSAEPNFRAHDGEGSSTTGRKDQLGDDAPTGGISVAPPPLPKSSAVAPRVAGAWPSGGAGTRTAKAAADAAVGTTATAAAASLTAATSKPDPAQKGSGRSSPRSASGGSKGRWVRRPPSASGKAEGEVVVVVVGGGGGGGGGRRGVDSDVSTGNENGSRAASGKQPKQEPSPERSQDEISNKKGLNNNTTASSNNGDVGNSTKPNRQHRSSSISWVEEAATGKHYQPASPTKATIEPAVDSLPGSTSRDGTARRPSPNLPLGAGQQDGGNTISGSKPKEAAKTKPTSTPQEVVESAASNPTEESGTREAVVTVSHRASGNSSGRDHNTPNRRTSSISWAEDLVAEMGESGASSSLKEAAVTASRRADGNDNGHGHGHGHDGGGDDVTPNRRTSISWAEDLVARTGKEAVRSRDSAAA